MATPTMRPSDRENGDGRLAALRGYNIMDTPREASFDEIVAVAAMLCKAPVSAINFIDRDRQWSKAIHGIEALPTPMEQSICAHTIRQPDVLIVNDIAKDERFVVRANDAPASAHRFYAGAPIETADGHRIGTLCVLDLEARDLAEDQKAILRMLARRAMTELELRSALQSERAARIVAEQLLSEKESLLARNDVLLREIDHRVKNSLQLVASMLAVQTRGLSDRNAAQSLREAQQRIGGIAAIHEQLYRASNSDSVELSEFLNGLCASLAVNRPESIGLIVVEAEPIVVSSKRAMKVGLLVNELVTNAFKHAYTAGQQGDVFVTLSAEGNVYRLAVRDRGAGFPDTAGLEQCTGLGMRLIRSIVEQVGGMLKSRGNAGGEFVIDIPFGSGEHPARAVHMGT